MARDPVIDFERERDRRRALRDGTVGVGPIGSLDHGIIVFKLTFDGGPEFTVTEDEGAEAVTVALSPGDEQLVLHASQLAGPGVLDELRSWIEARIDVASLPFSKSRVTARGTYWRDRAFRSRWGRGVG